MRNKGVAAAAAAVAVAVVIVALLLFKHGTKVQRSSTLVHVSGVTSSPAGGTTPLTSARRKVSGVFTGPIVDMRYGPVQAAISVRHGVISDVQAVQYPVERPRSRFINSQAIPLLRSETLQAQSAAIDLVTGATYTSDAFAASLQAAIGQEQARAAAQ